jgi:hypothetical protein
MIIRDETLVRKTIEINSLTLRYERHIDAIKLFKDDELLFEIPANNELELSKVFHALGDIAAEAPARKPGRKVGFKLTKIPEVIDEI